MRKSGGSLSHSNQTIGIPKHSLPHSPPLSLTLRRPCLLPPTPPPPRPSSISFPSSAAKHSPDGIPSTLYLFSTLFFFFFIKYLSWVFGFSVWLIRMLWKFKTNPSESTKIVGFEDNRSFY